jgi:3-hydroxyisobutyrate dehydrogenase-like beta-hydroxyacid dehydrogenase
MGSAVGASLVQAGVTVTTCLDGRSDASKRLAASAGMQDTDNLKSLVEGADLFLSIMPPAAASGFARQLFPLIEATGSDLLFVECNAISPANCVDIARAAVQHGIRFQDAGIVGASPRTGRSPVRIYTSGKHLEEMNVIATDLIKIMPVGSDIGSASALKMVYASLTKGTHALRAAALMAGEALGVGDEIRKEWQHSLPDVYRAMEGRMPKMLSASGRWAGEMREIAETYDAVGLTPDFHKGAEWIFELLATADANPTGDIDDALGSIMAALEKR